jgi:hypothetical protein
VTVFEGARLITGDGSAPIENSAFIVENNLFTRVGRRGELQVPAGTVHVNLTGKTVIPTMVDLHGHIGFQHVAEGTMSKEFYTHENLIDHLERLAYHGVGATVSIGDLEDRSDLHGGRTNWGDVPLRVREEIIPNAAQCRPQPFLPLANSPLLSGPEANYNNYNSPLLSGPEANYNNYSDT